MITSLAQLAGLFTAPALAVAGAACVAIPVIIHLLSRTRRTREEWGAMRFLRLAFKKQKRKLRMEKWLLLLTRCAVMLIAGLALAGPLLSGVWGGSATGLGSGRTVHLVLEDGLSTRAAVGEGVRFDQLKATALDLLDGVSRNDTVQLWVTSSPEEPHPATPSPTLDHGKVRSTLEELEPAFGRSTMAELLPRVAAAIDAESSRTRPPPVVALLSDFARGADYLEQALPTELATLGERATFVVTRPDVGSGNLQIQTLRPRRSLLLTGQQGPMLSPDEQGPAPSVSVEVVVRRFDGTASAAAGEVELFLTAPDGTTLPAVTRPVNWSAGQSTATLSVDIPLASSEAESTPIYNSGQSGMWTVTAVLAGEAGAADAVSEDDRRFAVVEVRSQLSVGVVDDGAAGLGGTGLSPAAFVRAALSPEETGQRFAVVTESLLPATMDADRIERLDAVLVLRPDALGNAGWGALADFARAGGLVWVFPPATLEPAARDWFSLMRTAMEVDWQLDEEAPVRVAAPGQAMRLDSDARPPSELLLLSADWSDLLGPVRIDRSLAVATTQPDEAWITLADTLQPDATSEQDDSSAAQAGVFLASAGVGEGRLLLTSVAVDAGWSNLPTKPVFPALLHDALRGVLGDVSATDESLAGQPPTLGTAWSAVTRLKRVGGETLVQRFDDEPWTAIDEPGVYGPSADGQSVTSGERVAVNVPADAGDVRAVNEAQLAVWLDGFGAWDYLDADDPASVMVTAEKRTNLGWALLWVLLALVLIEMLLARWFSHAESPRRGRAGQVSMDRRASDRNPKTKKKWSPFGRAAVWLGAAWTMAMQPSTASANSGWDSWLGLDEVSFAEATAIGWRFPLPAWAWVLIVTGSLLAAWWTYRRLLGPVWARALLAGLRGLLLVLIAVLLAGPEVVRTDETVEEDVLLVLVDRSASMTVADTSGGADGLVSREQALRDALTDQGQVFGEEQLGRGRQVAWMGFGEQAFELESPVGDAGLDALGEPGDQNTALRTALEAAMRRGAGRPISGIVLMSDGRSPEATGTDLLAKLEQQSVRVYSVPLGAERLPLDLALSRVDAPTTAFINDTVPVTVVVDQPSLRPGDEPIDPSRIAVRLIDTETQDVLDEKTLEDVGLGQPLRLEGQSSQTGEMPWAVEVVYTPIDAAADDDRELNLTNNKESFAVNMIDRPIRVLYIEGYPRWEYRYLKNMLIREQSIDSSIMLLSADRAFAQEGDTPITRLPNSDEEWRRYDAVIIGDVPAESMSPEQRKQLHDLVSQRGAGVLWVAGQGSMPSTYSATMLSDLLPMRDPEAVSLLPWARAAVVPTPLADTLSVLQLRSVDAGEDAQPGWPEDLPGLRWVQDLGELKPSAEVLANVMPSGSEEPGDQPLVTRLRFGSGQSLYVATDETWRWRYARGEVYFEQFWVQLVRMLGRDAATRTDQPVRLAVSTRSTPVGGTVVVDLDIEDAALLARDLPSVKVAVRRADDALERDLAEFELRPASSVTSSLDETSRRYTAPWLANLPGALELVATDPALSGLDLRVPLDVIASDDEMRRAEADVPRLVRLAESTGGRVVPLNELSQLAEPGVVRNLARKTANDVAEPIWNSALALVLVVVLITLEWIGRKLVRLV